MVSSSDLQTTRPPLQGLSSHRHAHRFAPLADAGIADAVNGLVGPFHRRGRKGLGVGVAGCGVEGERDEAFAVAAVDLDFADVEKGAEAAPIPIDEDLHPVNEGVDIGLDRGVIGAGLLLADDAERGADGFVIGRAAFDLFDQGAEPDFDARGDGGHGCRKYGRNRGAGRRWIAAAAGEVFPASPLQRAVAHELLAGQDVTEVIGVRRLRGDLGRADAKGDGVAGNGVLEGLELSGEGVVVEADVAGLRHNVFGFDVRFVGLELRFG